MAKKPKNKTETPTAEHKCAAQHFGPWMVHPQWFSQAVAAVKAGTFQPEHATTNDAAIATDPNVVGEWKGDCFKVSYYRENGIARIPFFGQVVKGDSSFGGASSVWTRRSVRKAVNDGEVSAILLHIDSPGGTVSGTGDLADEIHEANQVKPVYTYFEDLGASAAYWIGCQGRHIFANPTAEIGSIGTMTYVEDTSGMYEKAGIKVTLIATGKFKGQWIDGNPVSEEYIESVRESVADLNEHFLAGVMRGRNMSREHLATIADGRCFIADKAKNLGLIDSVSTLEAAMAAITKETSTMTGEAFNTYAAEHPEAVAGYIEKGKKAGMAEGASEERTRCIGILEAHGLIDHAAAVSIASGHDVETAKVISAAANKARSEAEAKAKADAEAHAKALAAKDQEIERLKFESQGQGAIGTAGATKDEPKQDVDTSDPKAVAKAEWAAMDATARAAFVSEDIFVRARARDLAAGQ